MSKKSDYKLENEAFINNLNQDPEVNRLPSGIYYKVIKEGESTQSPKLNSIVNINYKGSLINGHVFDNSWNRGYPEAFRLNQLIEGWQLALPHMHIGDHWIIYIPFNYGYGTKRDGDIPGFSTLIFEIELLGIG